MTGPSEMNFEEQYSNGTTIKQLQIKNGIQLDSSSAASTDPSEKQQAKTSLHLISELCDRLVETPKDCKHPYSTECVTNEGTLLDTPIKPAPQRLNWLDEQSDLSCGASQRETFSQFTSDTNISARLGPVQAYNGSCACVQCNRRLLMLTNNYQATEHSNKDLSVRFHEPLAARPQSTDTISCMEQMIQRISPTHHNATPSYATWKRCEPEISSDVLQSGFTLSNFDSGATSSAPSPQSSAASSLSSSQNSPGKYAELLAVIEELGKDIRPTYAGSKNAAERLKKGIMHARVLVRECLVETDRCARQ